MVDLRTASTKSKKETGKLKVYTYITLQKHTKMKKKHSERRTHYTLRVVR